ncbi:hypothetical protein KP509_11G083500 [Ceratopteris richardii]|uniref:Uncharacterized protein n=1 Tax=Ceratopteris richardii TaxID=49495 RepID=A0A8T2TWV9_CERRI|nr:hypothetical protein KP509_11G083500 [Ceratopteris richardii]
MVWQPAFHPWTSRVRSGPWENDTISITTHIPPCFLSSSVCRGLPQTPSNGLPFCNENYLLLSRSSNRRKPRAKSCNYEFIVSAKLEDVRTSSVEFFEIARRKLLIPYHRAAEDSFPSDSGEVSVSIKNSVSHGRDSISGLFQTGHSLHHFLEATKYKDAQNPRLLLLELKEACNNAYRSGVSTIESTQYAPLLPYSGPLLAVTGFALILGLLIGKWIGKRFTQSIQSSNVANLQALTFNELKGPTDLSVFLGGNMKKKESVEWVNMVLGKLWKVYRLGLEGWIVGLLQPLIDNLQKPDYVSRVEIKRFDLGDEPISIRSVERRMSRRANDLQYHIGLRYTGGARMLLLLKLRAGFITITIPVGVRELDVDGELWVKLRLVPSEPWVGSATWAFVSLPKIKLVLSPFRLFNLMAYFRFLTKLLTEDLPSLFVRPNKNVVDFLQGRVVGPVPKDFRIATTEGNKGFTGELSVTLVDARKLWYSPFGKTDPYVIFNLGDQVIRSKKNSQTSVFGPPGAPIWNQNFRLLVVDPKSQRLDIRVRDFIGLTAVTVGTGEVDLISLRDTVPLDKVIKLKAGWGPFRKSAGEVLLRLTYTAYVDDESEDIKQDVPLESANERGTVTDKIDDTVVPEIGKALGATYPESGRIKQSVTALSNVHARGLEQPDQKGPERENNVGAVAVKVPDKEDKFEKVSSDIVKTQVFTGSFILMWLGVVALLSILVALSLNFSNLLNP